jgi:hypothetical protein
MNEQQTQFPAHALSLAFCRSSLCDSGRFDAAAGPSRRALTKIEE